MAKRSIMIDLGKFSLSPLARMAVTASKGVKWCLGTTVKEARLELGWKRAELLEEKAKENIREGGRHGAEVTNQGFQKSEKAEPINTTAEAAKFAGVSTEAPPSSPKRREKISTPLKKMNIFDTVRL